LEIEIERHAMTISTVPIIPQKLNVTLKMNISAMKHSTVEKSSMIPFMEAFSYFIAMMRVT
jgi:hypothetical protein